MKDFELFLQKWLSKSTDHDYFKSNHLLVFISEACIQNLKKMSFIWKIKLLLWLHFRIVIVPSSANSVTFAFQIRERKIFIGISKKDFLKNNVE